MSEAIENPKPVPATEEECTEEEYSEQEHGVLLRLGFPMPSRRRSIRASRAAELRRAMRDLQTEERGAVTAEYALIIMAAVAFAGALILILRSEEVRQMLLDLVQTALGSAG